MFSKILTKGLLGKIFFRHKAEDFAMREARVLRRYESLAERLASRPDYEDYDSSPLAQYLYETYNDKLKRVGGEESKSYFKSTGIAAGAGAILGYFLVKGVNVYNGNIDPDDTYQELIGGGFGLCLGAMTNSWGNAYRSARLEENDTLVGHLTDPWASGVSTNDLKRISNKHLGSSFKVYKNRGDEVGEEDHSWYIFNERLGTIVGLAVLGEGLLRSHSPFNIVAGAGFTAYCVYRHHKDTKRIKEFRANKPQNIRA